jgi:hypothetical protein
MSDMRNWPEEMQIRLNFSLEEIGIDVQMPARNRCVEESV